MDQDATWQGSRPQTKRHCVVWGPRSPLRKGAEPSNFWPVSIVAKRLDGSRCHLVGRYRPQPKRHCFSWGPSSPSQNGSRAPILGRVYCGQTAGWIKMPLGREVGLSPSDIVLDRDPAPPPPKGAEPQFSSHVCCGQTARWIKMALGTEVSLGSAQRRCVRWGTSSPSLKGARPPVFGACL